MACQTKSVMLSSVSCEAGVAMIDASCQTDCKMMKDECCQTDQLTDTSNSRTSMCQARRQLYCDGTANISINTQRGRKVWGDNWLGGVMHLPP